ncbi:MAG: type I pullulanase [Planctomycetota bacterium]
MNTLRLLALFFASLLSTHAIASPQPVSVADTHTSDFAPGERLIIVHYHRQDGDYSRWNLWTWSEGQEGRGVAFDRETEFGRYALIKGSQDDGRQGLIVRKGEWEQRDIDFDRFIAAGPVIEEVWLVAGNPAVFTDPATVDLSTRIKSAFLDDADTITFTSTGPLSDEQVASATITTATGAVYTAGDLRRSQRTGAAGVVYELPFSPRVADADVAALRLDVTGMDPVTVYARDVLDEDRFTAPLATLGNLYSHELTIFRTWSPVSDRVLLNFYNIQRAGSKTRTVEMERVGNGVWEAIVTGDLDRAFYDYTFFSYGKERTAADIHARAAAFDSNRSVVVDLRSTDPVGWDEHEPPRSAHHTDEIIYEIHVRDLSVRDDTLEEHRRGMYSGLIHRGEKLLPNDASVKTGLAHLEELGVTAVHLLPVHDFPTSDRNEYNWGYWTTLFNVPEGNYAIRWGDPKSPIRELKTAIKGLHDAGIRVILDVVYNHTSSSFEYSHFDNTVPWYFFRTTVDGKLRNDAGVGNSVADERVMVDKYIRDSLVYWTREYKVDGYRFDLLGTHNPDSVRGWVDTLRDVRPDLTIYGEPWTGGGPTYFPKGAQRSMGIAVFNDHLRNAIRGDLDGDATGFASGPSGDTASIRRGIVGAIDDFTDGPAETINYASAHDNLTLFDKITRVTPDATDETRRRMLNLAHATVLTAQGVAFIHGGADFARTKGGNHNSYNAGDDVNKFDWPRKHAYRDVFDYTRGLIALRKAHPAFRMRTTQDVRRNVTLFDTNDDRLVAWSLDGEAVGDPWSTIVVVLNGSDVDQRFDPPAGAWDVVVDDSTAGVETLRTVTGTLRVPPYSALVLKRD